MNRLKQFEAEVRSYSEILWMEDVQLHHVLGRHAKCHWDEKRIDFGWWYIIGLPERLHDVGSNNESNVTHYPANFEHDYGEQWNRYATMIRTFVKDNINLPDDDVLLAIILKSKSWI